MSYILCFSMGLYREGNGASDLGKRKELQFDSTKIFKE